MFGHNALTIGLIMGSIACLARAQVPGFEIVYITDNPSDFSHVPKINDCGEVVFSTWIDQLDSNGEILLYDNGRHTRITDNNIRDDAPDINNAGTIVWTRWAGNYDLNEVVMLAAGQVMSVGIGSVPAINNLGHVAWKRFESIGCASPSAIYFYDGDTVQLVVDDGLSNQSVELNDNDELVWTKYDFCPEPWESDTWYWSSGVSVQLTDWQAGSVAPAITNAGRIMVSYRPIPALLGLWVWEPDDPTGEQLTEWGAGGRLNEIGDVAFYRWHGDAGTYQMWLYRGGQFIQLTDDPYWDVNGDINEDGEVVWQAGDYPASDVYFLRRIRTSDSGEGGFELGFDGDIDLRDFAILQRCITGPGDFDRLCDCRFLDIDHDRDVDLDDFTLFTAAMTGPG